MKNINVYQSARNLKKAMKYLVLATAFTGTISGVKIGVDQVTEAQQQKMESLEDYTKVYASVPVDKGDTLYSLAEEEFSTNPDIYETAYEDLRTYVAEVENANQMRADSLKAGENIQMPVYRDIENVEQSFAGLNYYTVQAGDTLESIAQHFGTTVEAICLQNNLSKDQILTSGTPLTVYGNVMEEDNSIQSVRR
ncbi:MAG: LysM peptidoglycan-binding domain-containing protein [Bacilli bacterium]|nr:LysM peptidoglycan-binding domain-containing protein [Bacilli bacterium]